MADIVSAAKRSSMMSAIKGKDTKPEIVVRKILFSLGYRYRLRQKDLPGKPDIVLRKWNAVIFVNGCFWHGHQRCHLFRIPKTRKAFWYEKISGNTRRDKRNTKFLATNGWRIYTIWECALKGKNKLAPDKIAICLDLWLKSEKKKIDVSGKRHNSP